MTLQQDVSLKEHTNYYIGGNARYFVEVHSENEVRDALKWASDQSVPFFILGGGTNIVVSDAGYDGLVICMKHQEVFTQGDRIIASSGVSLDSVVDMSIEAGLAGLEWAGGLPGTIGGAVYGNVGAFGGEIKDILVSVKVCTPENKIVEMPLAECEMAYRESKFKKEEGWVILSAHFQLQAGRRDDLHQQAERWKEWRRTKHPIEYHNCGSVFKRIPVEDLDHDIVTRHPDISGAIRENKVAIAYFIDQCGLKQYNIGGIEVSEKHPNFLINKEKKGTAEEVLMLIHTVKHNVLDTFGVFLQEEIEFVGFEDV